MRFLGCSRAEIKRKFDEIVAFAEVEQFLDTPVKRYSSGMYVRLAFAVAAHLEPEILIVDEVLAVGDAEFQKKCLGKMRDVSGREGRTVILVSHNMAAVRNLCQRGLCFEKGRVIAFGDIQNCIANYQRSSATDAGLTWKRNGEPTSKKLFFDEISVELSGEQPALKLTANCRFKKSGSPRPCNITIDILDSGGTPIMQALPSLMALITPDNSDCEFKIEVALNGLVPGNYSLSFWVGPHNTETYDLIQNCISFPVSQSPTPGRTYPHTVDHGFIVPESRILVIDPIETVRP